MRLTKTITSIILFPGMLMACSGTAGDKSSSSTSNDPGGSSGSGKDLYFEYKLTTTGSSDSRGSFANGIIKYYISSKGDMRTEGDWTITYQGKQNPVQIVAIGHADKPDESIDLDDSAKTYTVTHFNPEDFKTGVKTQSSVSKIGEEKIMGFNCVHAQIIETIGFPGAESFMNDPDTIDLWRSNDVTLPANVKELMGYQNSKSNNTMFSPDVEAQLKQMGCGGFMVKMTSPSEGLTINGVLTKVEHRDLPASLFQIPAGYKEDKSGGF